MEKVTVISGYFLAHLYEHLGYQDYLKLAKSFGNKVIAIINNRNDQILKYGDVIRDPVDIAKEWSYYVDYVYINEGEDGTVSKTLEKIKNKYHVLFVKDAEYNIDNLPEKKVKGIDFYFGNNPKKDSSSKILGIKKLQ